MPFFRRRGAKHVEEEKVIQIENPVVKTPATLEQIVAMSSAATYYNSPKTGRHAPQDSSSSEDRKVSSITTTFYESSGSSSGSSRTSNSSGSPAKNSTWPRSRKMGNGKILTDATNSQEAFESDAFAIHMPTTRVPVFNFPVVPSPRAQAEAVKTYAEKARQERVKVPARLIVYEQPPGPPKHAAPEPTPRSPAGSFPISPPLRQEGWASPDLRSTPNVQGPREFKPVAARRLIVNRADSIAGAAPSSSSVISTPSASIRVRVKPRVVKETAPVKERVQKESTYAMYNRAANSSKDRSRSSSPEKSMPNFTRPSSIEGDSIFGYTSRRTISTGPSAPNSSNTSSKSDSDTPKELPVPVKDTKPRAPAKTNKSPIKRTLTAWLKPKPLPVVPDPKSEQKTKAPSTGALRAARTAYVSPFAPSPPPEATARAPPPACLRTASKKTTATSTLASSKPNPHYSIGVTQVAAGGIFLLKLALFIYAVFAVWYVMHAIRDAFWTIGAPFRWGDQVLRWSWIGVVWLAKWGLKMWERWGFKIKIRGGWYWAYWRRWW